MKKYFLLFLFCSSARAAVLDVKSGSTSFTAVGRPSAIKINGKGQGPSGEISLAKSASGYLLNGEVQVDLESFDTGIGMRDRHMKEKYLETAKYKSAILRFVNAPLPESLAAAPAETTVPAILVLHGLEKPIQVAMQTRNENGLFKTESRFHMKLSDHAIAVPSFSGITVADEVDVTARTEVPVSSVIAGGK